jgi:uncharacterized metal-binding protein YceD (DUF177 family)
MSRKPKAGTMARMPANKILSVAAPPTEFPRPFDTEGIGNGPAERHLEAKPEERAAIARRLDLVGIDALKATFTLTRLAGGVVRVDGRINAVLTQTCVVTLDPFATTATETFTALFARHDEIPQGDVIVDPDADLPEPMDGTRVDLGELVIQHLSLALDPYPRAPGVAFTGVSAGESEENEDGPADPAMDRNPFAALAKLGRRN